MHQTFATDVACLLVQQVVSLWLNYNVQEVMDLVGSCLFGKEQRSSAVHFHPLHISVLSFTKSRKRSHDPFENFKNRADWDAIEVISPQRALNPDQLERRHQKKSLIVYFQQHEASNKFVMLAPILRGCHAWTRFRKSPCTYKTVQSTWCS